MFVGEKHASPQALRRQGPISGCFLLCMREQQEMDTCLRRYLRNGRIRLIPLRAILTPCSHRSRIRYRSGCGGRVRRVRVGETVSPVPRQVRPGWACEGKLGIRLVRQPGSKTSPDGPYVSKARWIRSRGAGNEDPGPWAPLRVLAEIPGRRGGR